MEVRLDAFALLVHGVHLVAAAVLLDAADLPALVLQHRSQFFFRLPAVARAGVAGGEASGIRGQRRSGRGKERNEGQLGLHVASLQDSICMSEDIIRIRTRRIPQMRKLVAALALAPALAFAQAYPTKPVRIVLPFGPGGVADITTRTITPKMSETLGQQLIVDNMPGAGGIRASETVAHAAPDGYTILLLTNGNAVSKALFNKLPYDPETDFAMISTVGYFSMVIVTREDGNLKTLQDALSYAKANPGKMNIATITPGGTQHLAGELFRSMAGIDALVVPHKTTGEVILSTRQGATHL